MSPKPGVVAAVVVAIAVALGRAAAGTLDGYEWPPDPKRFAPVGTEVAPGLKIGDTLGASNAGAAKDLLPPEVLAHYQKDEYQNPIVSWPDGIIHWDHSFEAATKQNEGKYTLELRGRDRREGAAARRRSTSTATRSRPSRPTTRRAGSRRCGTRSTPSGTSAATTSTR